MAGAAAWVARGFAVEALAHVVVLVMVIGVPLLLGPRAVAVAVVAGLLAAGALSLAAMAMVARGFAGLRGVGTVYGAAALGAVVVMVAGLVYGVGVAAGSLALEAYGAFAAVAGAALVAIGMWRLGSEAGRKALKEAGIVWAAGRALLAFGGTGLGNLLALLGAIVAARSASRITL